MIDKKAIAILVAIGVGSLASAGAIYLYQQGALPRFDTAEQTPAAPAAIPQDQPPPPQTAAPPEPAPAPKPKAEATGAMAPADEPTAVPSFDVVVIEPSGEGVIAGRAAPGWQVSIESGGSKLAAATADAQGEWSAVLEKPLPAGDHALSLKITSPDGTRALSSQERVRVEVGDTTKTASGPADAALSPSPSQPASTPTVPQITASGTPTTAVQGTTPPTQAAELALAEPRAVTRAVSPRTEESAPAPQVPKLVFKTVDYEDTGSSIGTVSITGTSDPGATIKVYSDEKPLATVRADRDGIWSVVVEKKLGTGQHSFRAERINAATGETSTQATIAIERLVPKPPEVAAAEPIAGGSATASPVGTESKVPTKDVYTVQRGDTLWAIAKRYFGSGLRYPAIFQDNREIIKDPDLIHPKQEVKVPTQ